MFRPQTLEAASPACVGTPRLRNARVRLAREGHLLTPFIPHFHTPQSPHTVKRRLARVTPQHLRGRRCLGRTRRATPPFLRTVCAPARPLGRRATVSVTSFRSAQDGLLSTGQRRGGPGPLLCLLSQCDVGGSACPQRLPVRRGEVKRGKSRQWSIMSRRQWEHAEVGGKATSRYL